MKLLKGILTPEDGVEAWGLSRGVSQIEGDSNGVNERVTIGQEVTDSDSIVAVEGLRMHIKQGLEELGSNGDARVANLRMAVDALASVGIAGLVESHKTADGEADLVQALADALRSQGSNP